MENEIWLQRLENLANSRSIRDVGDSWHILYVRRGVVEFSFDVIDAVFAASQQNDLARLELGKLTTELRADRTAGSGDQNRLSVDDLLDRSKIQIDWLTTQQVIVRNFPDRNRVSSSKMIFQRRQDPNFESTV